ncbi:hypothetical protein [Pedobacter sp. SYP-B3415]|uniref:hypothetical protein n=1 Tax=Pedobacter sp. SYP-B3415 TaxID=2496641 RepID=UPI00101BE1B0|nr:hypothetical protein [Pedobacter sp. SYP-B3415]
MVFRKLTTAANIYFLGLRLFLAAALGWAVLGRTNAGGPLNDVTNSYHLSVFQLEFYFLLLILFGFRPARFRSRIETFYAQEKERPFSKDTFFLIVYIGTLAVVFGIPLLVLRGAIPGVLEIMHTSNKAIVHQPGVLTVAALFLLLNFLRMWFDLRRSVDMAKVLFARTLYGFLISVPVCIVLYILISLFQPADLLSIALLAFNATFLFFDLREIVRVRDLRM